MKYNFIHKDYNAAVNAQGIRRELGLYRKQITLREYRAAVKEYRKNFPALASLCYTLPTWRTLVATGLVEYDHTEELDTNIDADGIIRTAYEQVFTWAESEFESIRKEWTLEIEEHYWYTQVIIADKLTDEVNNNKPESLQERLNYWRAIVEA